MWRMGHVFWKVQENVPRRATRHTPALGLGQDHRRAERFVNAEACALSPLRG